MTTEVFSPLLELARQSLHANIHKLNEGPVLTAGSRQFKALWTRDFCHSVRGLLCSGRQDVARDHLSLLLRNARVEDGLVPRLLDCTPTMIRVGQVWLENTFPFLRRDIALQDPIKPEYEGEHGTLAIDSNLFVLLASTDYLRATGDQEWWNEQVSPLRRVLSFYDTRIENGLITQPAFSDWQDSVRRTGTVFLTNLLFWVVLKRLSRFPGFGITDSRIAELRAKLIERFQSRDGETEGLFFSLAQPPHISLEGNLLAIDLGFFEPNSPEADRLYGRLKQHPLWSGKAGLPGFVTYPDYPEREKALSVRWVGLDDYHDRLYWSWLLGLSAKVAVLQKDRSEAERILSTLQRLAIRDGGIAEIYAPDPELKLWRSRWFRSELPFSWGSAYILDALDAFQRANRT